MKKRLPKDYQLLFRLLKALSASGKRVVPDPTALEGWRVQSSDGVKGQTVLDEIVQLGRRSDYLKEADANALALSDTGKKALKRYLASEDAFLSQHREISRERYDGMDAPLTVNLSESPLAWLARRKDKSGKPLLSKTQILAGERLRQDFSFACLMPDMAGGWKVEQSGLPRGSGKSSGDLKDDVIAAKDRVQRTLDSLEPKCARVLVDVCCYLKGLETVEAEQGWPARSAKIVLQIALNSLAVQYGMVVQSKRAGGQISVWTSQADQLQ